MERREIFLAGMKLGAIGSKEPRSRIPPIEIPETRLNALRRLKTQVEGDAHPTWLDPEIQRLQQLISTKK